MFSEPISATRERIRRLSQQYPELRSSSASDVMAVDEYRVRTGGGAVTRFSQDVMRVAKAAAEQERRREEERRRTGPMPAGIDERYDPRRSSSRYSRPVTRMAQMAAGAASAEERLRHDLPAELQGRADLEAAAYRGGTRIDTPGVALGVAEAFPEEASGRKVYGTPGSLDEPLRALVDAANVLGTPGRVGVAALSSLGPTGRGELPLRDLPGNVRRAITDPYSFQGVDTGLAQRMPDSGLSLGPLHITPRTLTGFGIDTIADVTTWMAITSPQINVKGIVGQGDNVAVRAGESGLAERAARIPATAGGAPIGPMLDPMHPSSATQRLFNIRQPQQMLTRTDRVMNALKSATGWGVEADDYATPIMRERRRVLQNSESQANRLGALAGTAEVVFERDAAGRITNLPGQPTIQDLAAKLPMYQSYLTPDQVAAMQMLRREVMPYGDALRELGYEFGDRPDIIDGGFYLPRGNAMEEGADVPRKVGTGRGRGKAGSMKSVKFEESMTQGIDAGYEYAPFPEALQSYARRAGQDAADQWTATAFKATGLGESAADRINPGLRAQVETLRAKIAQRRATLVRQRARRTPLNQAARDAERMATRAEKAAGRAGARMESIAGRAGERGERIAQRADDMLGKAAGAQERAAQETVGLADKARERLRRLQWRIDEIKKPLATAVEGEPIPTEAPSFQQIISNLPDRQATLAKATELRGQLTRDANGRILRNRKNAALIKQIAELDTIGELHYALERAGGDIAESMDLFYEQLNRNSNALQTRANSGQRLVMSGNTGARMRAQTKRASKRKGYDAYVNTFVGTDEDYDILREQVTAMADVVEAADFEVFPDLDTPANLGNAPTEEVMAAAQRELRILEREANKQTRRADRASAKAVRQGDALMTQAQRNTAQGAADAQRGAKAAQRGTGAQWKTATRAEQRAATRDAAEAATGAEYDQLRDDLRNLMGQWKKAKEQAAQTPRDQGSIGLPGLNGTTFPDSVANAANTILNDEKAISGKGAIPVRIVQAVNSLLRSLNASVDVSFLGIQGQLGAVTHPREYAQAMGVAMKAMNDERALGAYIRNFDEVAQSVRMPDSRAWASVGLRIGGADTEFAIGQGLGPKVGRAIRNAPAIKQSNRMFGYFGDSMRLEVADALARASRASGKQLTPEHLAEIAHAANLVTGAGGKSLGGATGDLFFFAPRFFASQLELAGRALTLDPSPAGDEARQALIRLLGVGTLLTVGMNEARGKETDFSLYRNGRVNGNFMRIRDLGGQDISLFGPWDSLLRGIAATVQGDYTYMARTKASPTVSIVWDLVYDESFMGDRARTPEYMLRRLLPFSLSEIGRESPLKTAISMTGVKTSDLTLRERLDNAARRYGEQQGLGTFDTLDELAPAMGLTRGNAERKVREANPGLDARLTASRDERAATGDEMAARSMRADELQAQMDERQRMDDERLDADPGYAMQWRENTRERQKELAIRKDEIYQGVDFSKGPWTVLDEYFRQIDNATDQVTGEVDWDAVDAWRGGLSPVDDKFIDDNTGLKGTAKAKEWRDDRRKIDEAGYWGIRDIVFDYFLQAQGMDGSWKFDDYWTEVRKQYRAYAIDYLDRANPGWRQTSPQADVLLANAAADKLRGKFDSGLGEARKQWLSQNLETYELLTKWGYRQPGMTEAMNYAGVQ